MLIIFLTLILSGCNLIFGNNGTYYTNKINDYLLGEYEFVLDFSGEEETDLREGRYLVCDNNNAFTLNEISEKLSSSGYIIRFEKNAQEQDCLIISLLINNNPFSLFVLQYTNSNKNPHQISIMPLTYIVDFISYPFPIHSQFSNSKVETDENGSSFNTTPICLSYEQFKEFYSKTINGIYSVDDENKTIIVKGVDLKQDNSFNSYVKLTFVENDEENEIVATRYYLEN